MSGGTLIALAADEIAMDPNAVPGPVDPQLNQSPAASILTVLQAKKPEDIDDQTLLPRRRLPQGHHPAAKHGPGATRRADAAPNRPRHSPTS
jgi:ClpP class serine protease